MTPAPRTPGTAPHRGGRPGLSIVEVMIALAITAGLLTAIAAAFGASSKLIEENDRFSRAVQAGRVAVNQMLTEARRCDSVDVTPTEITIIRPLQTRPANEKTRHYLYDAATQRLVLYFTYMDGSVSTAYPLASQVFATSPFTADIGKDANNTDCVSRVAVKFDVRVGGNTIEVSGAAAPRRSLAYK